MPKSPDLVDELSVTQRTAEAVAASIAHGPHRMTIGLRPLALADWIDDGADFAAQLRERATLLRERADVVCALPGSQAAQRELLALLIVHLRVHFAQAYAFSAPGKSARVTVKATGQSVSLADDQADDAALRGAAQLVPEDLCLLQADESGSYRLRAAALCFPTRWRLADKLGQPLLDIHAAVPGYAREIGAAADRVLRSLDAARPLWRHNWSLLDSPVLHQPARIELQRALEPADFGARLWMRCERQTLRRLPQSGAVLFTIRIRQCTLDALCQQSGAAERLLSQLQTMPAALRAYKGLDQIDAPLRAYLRAASRVSIASSVAAANSRARGHEEGGL